MLIRSRMGVSAGRIFPDGTAELVYAVA